MTTYNIYEAIDHLNAETEAQNALNQNILQQFSALVARVSKLEKPVAAVKLPYPNFENSKYTFPDKKEYPALDVIKMTSEYIKFNTDGSITYNLPAGLTGTPTANAKYLRIERREYKNMATKSNYKKGDVISRSMGVTFHKLNLGVDDVVFSQVHGVPWVQAGVESDTPYFKMVAGKTGVRIQAKTKFALPKDDVVILLMPASELKEGVEYPLIWSLDGTTLNYSFNGVKGVINYSRPDEYYPKDGAYGPVGVSLTHRAL
jgi:hypothetical protein